ncbi:MAG: DUF5343 domain-containing protein [Chloroflexi bacterium]|nr:DUF5343 domain-containing protein [Chloroflexota bacterium]
MTVDESRKRLPPYISYRTFCNFVDRLQEGLPSRIDRSYWGDMMSGSTGTQLLAALRFLGLVDPNGRPTAQLKQLAIVKGEQKTETLRQLTSGAFSFVFQSSFDPENATYSQLQELFNDAFQPAEDVCRKCIKFFVALANDAEIPLSPFITKRVRAGHAGPGTKVSTKKGVLRTKRNVSIPSSTEEIPEQISWNRMLLTKFPSFDPNWNDDVKLKWFAAFDELLKRNLQGGERSG